MPVLDGDFEAFVTNLGKYNEGELVGEWVKFPTTEEELKKVFERIGIGAKDSFGNTYEEWFITDYDCPINGVYQMLGEYENLDKLNYLAALIDELSKGDQEKLVAIMNGGCDRVSDIDDLINLTFNLDTYDFIPSVHDDEDLGYYYLHDAGIYSEKDLGPFANYIDYERYGRDVRFEEGGSFTDEGYVRSSNDSWNIQFDGSRDDIPDEYRITGSGEAEERSSMISVLMVEPGKAPYVKEIDSGLESLQHEVAGNIEAVYPFDEPVAIICNEEAKLEGLPLNRALRDNDGDIYDIVAGTFMVVGLTNDNFGSLSVEYMRQFTDLFKTPEQFAKHGDKIIAFPMISEEQQKLDSFKEKDYEVNIDTDGLAVSGHIGTWHTIDHIEVDGHAFFLMEHDTYGDEAASIIVDEHGRLVVDDVYNGFDDDTMEQLRWEVLPVSKLPDPTFSTDEMKAYGYAWGGMLPMKAETAKEVVSSFEIFRLYSDNTEGLVLDAKDIEDHAAKGGIFGVSKADWQALTERENPLKAAEMSTEDDYGMIDGIINNGAKDTAEKAEKSSIMDRLKSSKSEPQPEKPQPHKERKSEHDL